MLDKELEKKVDEAADLIIAKLYQNRNHKKYGELLNLETLMSKSVGSMTSEEKILAFFGATMKNDRVAMKALSEGSSADGGYLVPDEFRNEIIRDISDGGYMRNEVTVIPLKRDSMKIPTLAAGPKVTWTEENATKSTTTASFDEVTLTVKKMAAILYASDELVEDSAEVGIVNFIITLFAEAIGREEDRVIWRGNGTTEPTGIVVAQAAGKITAVDCGGVNLSFDSIIDLVYSLPAKYSKNAKFFVHRNNIREMRKLQDGSGRYIWSDPKGADGATCYGFPVVEVNDLGEDQIYFGDLKKGYWLGDKSKISVKVSQDTETAFAKDQTGIRVVERIAGNVVLGFAVKALINIA